MSRAEVALALVVAGMTVYAVLGGADYGAGFWDLTAGGARRGARLRGLIQRSMTPVWEANHVWLILVLVLLWSAFPLFAGLLGSSLYVPLFLAAVGIVLRGTAFALRGEAATIREARLMGGVFALSSVIVPFCLGTVIGALAAGRVTVAGPVEDPMTVWLGPTSLLTGTIAVATGAHLAAVFLARDATRNGFEDLADACRARAMGSGVVAGVLALGGLMVVRDDAPRLYEGLTSGSGRFLVVGSALGGVTTLVLLARRRLGAARASAVCAVAAMVVGWAVAQRGDLVPGSLSIEQAAAGDATLKALLISFAAGLVVLVPSLILLYTLVLRGRLDQDPEVLGHRYTPLTAGEDTDTR